MAGGGRVPSQLIWDGRLEPAGLGLPCPLLSTPDLGVLCRARVSVLAPAVGW